MTGENPGQESLAGASVLQTEKKTSLDTPVRRNKARLANYAINKHKATSFADLGACWGVNAGYTLHLLEENQIERAYVLDQTITERSRERGANFPQLAFVPGMLGEQGVIDSIPDVDALLMYDILLHQVNPDWDDFLTRWAQKARVLVIFNQMWMQEGPTVRFIDRGREWYKANVYYTNEARLDRWFDRHERPDEGSGKKQKERHAFWQWGIKTGDLIEHVRTLGFRLDFFENHGRFGPSPHPWIQDEAFIFVRD